MPQAFSCKNLALVLTIGMASWLMGGAARADEPGKGFTEEQIFAAFVEPARAESGGRISAQRRDSILAVARKVLDARQMRELEKKLAPYCDSPGGFAVLPDLSDRGPGAAPLRNPLQPAYSANPATSPKAAAPQPFPAPETYRSAPSPQSLVPDPPQPMFPTPETKEPAPSPQALVPDPPQPLLPTPDARQPATLPQALLPDPPQPKLPTPTAPSLPPANPLTCSPFPPYPAAIDLPKVDRPADDGPAPGGAFRNLENLFCNNLFGNHTWVPESRGISKYFDNLQVFVGLDGWRGPQDLGVNALMGGRTGLNWGIPILEEIGLGLQIGSAFNYGQNAVGVLETVNDTHYSYQSFTTVGLFQRMECGINWAAAWDYLYEHYWNDFSLNQVRAQVGYDINRNNEIGVWGTYAPTTTTATLNGTPFYLQSINQGNVFWRHIWPNEAVTRVWLGVAEEHDRFILVIPGRPTAWHTFTYGADVYIPLNNWISIFGQANFITPYDTGIVTATFGLSFSLGGRAQAASRDRFAPMLSVADNTTFPLNLSK